MSLASLFASCGNGGESTGSDKDSAMEKSTTPPPTADSTDEIGVMMGDTTTVYDNVDGGQNKNLPTYIRKRIPKKQFPILLKTTKA